MSKKPGPSEVLKLSRNLTVKDFAFAIMSSKESDGCHPTIAPDGYYVASNDDLFDPKK